MRIIGLTGNVASGKSTVAELWRSWGVPVVSADILARDAVSVGSPGLAEVAEAFGPTALARDGSMDRAAVRALVFDDDQARRRLEAIVHPRVRELRDRWTREREEWGLPVVAWEIPLLYETGADGEVDVVVLVDAPEDERIRRMMSHRGLSEEEAKDIMRAQGSATDKRRRADYVIDNDGDFEALRRRSRDTLAACRTALGVTS